MGYALLWLEALAGELLLWVTLVACLARIKRRFLRNVLVLGLVLVALAAYAGLLCVGGYFEAHRMAPEGWARPFQVLIGLCAVGAIVILLVGMRGRKLDPQRPAAATWPWGKLAVALAVALALNMMTFWNLDAAVKQRVDALRVEAGALALSVAPPRVPDRDNAAMVYEKAFELMGSQLAWSKKWDQSWTEWLEEGTRDLDPQERRICKFLEEQAPTLAVLREVVSKPACYFHHDYARPSFAMLLPEMRVQRAALLLALDARSQLAAGQLGTAIDDVNALFATAEHAGTVPFLVGMLVAKRVESLATDRLEEILASGEASAEQLARIQIRESLSYRRLYGRATRMEEALGLAAFYERGLPLKLEDTSAVDESSAWCTQLAPLYRVFLLENDLASYRNVMGDVQQLSALLDYHSITGEYWLEQQERLKEQARGVLTKALVPPLMPPAEGAARADARHRLAQFATAICRHRAATGDYPENLDEWASIIRPDPFDGKPLKWTSTGEALVLYSIGPDLSDDGGKPFDREAKTGDLIFTLPK